MKNVTYTNLDRIQRIFWRLRPVKTWNLKILLRTQIPILRYVFVTIYGLPVVYNFNWKFGGMASLLDISRNWSVWDKNCTLFDRKVKIFRSFVCVSFSKMSKHKNLGCLPPDPSMQTNMDTTGNFELLEDHWISKRWDCIKINEMQSFRYW